MMEARKFRSFRLLVLVLLASTTTSVVATAQKYLSENGTAEFRSKVSLHSFTGTSEHLVGFVNLADSTIDFYLDLSTLETGIGKRDKDMRQTLEVEKYPFAEFYGKLLSPINILQFEPQPAKVEGDFSIHGVTNRIGIVGEMVPVEDGMLVRAEWRLNLEDYAIIPPRFLIMKVDEIQEISIEIELESIAPDGLEVSK